MTGLSAVLVSVEYTDCLRVTLPYNRHHFDRVVVATSPTDAPNIADLCAENRVELCVTDAFYRSGAKFNKWLALEEGLDVLGRDGWLCVMDADVLWPKDLPVCVRGEWLEMGYGLGSGRHVGLKPGHLCTPRRRMFPTVPVLPPEESTWTDYPLHPVTEFSGYTQIFHARDPVLGAGPWYQTNWTHAGGADSFFQKRWSSVKKVRPPFEVLHIGEAGVNWCGRVSEVDGVKPPDAPSRRDALNRFMHARRGRRGHGADPYRGEKVSKDK